MGLLDNLQSLCKGGTVFNIELQEEVAEVRKDEETGEEEYEEVEEPVERKHKWRRKTRTSQPSTTEKLKRVSFFSFD